MWNIWRTSPAWRGRHCVAILLRGTSSSTVLATAHCDTMAMRDYGELENLATVLTL